MLQKYAFPENVINNEKCLRNLMPHSIHLKVSFNIIAVLIIVSSLFYRANFILSTNNQQVKNIFLRNH